jgi:TPR repeat protein
MPRRAVIALAVVLAAAPGFATSPFEDGLTAYRAEDYETARRIWEPLGEAGHAETQYYLGLMHVKGQGYPQSWETAVGWFRRAAEQGEPRAQNNLGSSYLMGKGVTADPTEATKWFRRSAEQGHAFGQNNLGRMYLEGEGVEQDLVEAYVWFNLAARQGVVMAQEQLTELNPRMQPAERAEGERRIIARRQAAKEGGPPIELTFPDREPPASP